MDGQSRSVPGLIEGQAKLRCLGVLACVCVCGDVQVCVCVGGRLGGDGRACACVGMCACVCVGLGGDGRAERVRGCCAFTKKTFILAQLRDVFSDYGEGFSLLRFGGQNTAGRALDTSHISTVCALSFAASLVEPPAQCESWCWTGGEAMTHGGRVDTCA